MKILYILVIDEDRARLYRSKCPPDQLSLIYHQRKIPALTLLKSKSFESKTCSRDEDFTKNLYTMLNLDCKASRFDGLILISTGDRAAMVRDNLSIDCRDRLLGMIESPRQPADQNILAWVQALIEKRSGACDRLTPSRVLTSSTTVAR